MIKTRFTLIAFVFIFSSILFNAACNIETYKQGKNLYNFYCATCHMEDGSGLKGLYPPLAGSDYLANHQDKLACIIQYGLKETITVNGKKYEQEMPAVEGLSPVQINNIINYVNTAWGNEIPIMKVADVQKQIDDCKPK